MTNLFKITSVIGIFLFILMLFSSVIYGVTGAFNIILKYVYVALFLMIIYLIYKKIHNKKIKITNKRFRYIIAIAFLVIIILQILMAFKLRIYPTTDRKHIYDQGLYILQTGQFKAHPDLNYYFIKYPNNVPFCLFEVSYMWLLKSFGYNGDIITAINFLNIFFIDLGILLSVNLVRKIKGNKHALMFFIMCALSAVTYFYVPFFYSDTFSLFIVAGILTLIYNLKNSILKHNNKKMIINSILLGILFFIGYKIKATIIIIFIALIMYFVLSKNINKKKMIVSLLIIFTLFSTQIIIYNNNIEKLNIFDHTVYDEENYPYTHWIYMGLNEKGNYNYQDDLYTQSFCTKDQKIQGNIEGIKRRVKDYGCIGLVKHQINKITYTWKSGLYDINFYINVAQHKDNFITSCVCYGGKNHNYLRSVYAALHFIMVLGLLVSSMYIFKKGKSDYKYMMFMSIVGLTVFLSIWETRPRYLVHYIPLIYFISYNGLNVLYRITDKLISKKFKIKKQAEK